MADLDPPLWWRPWLAPWHAVRDWWYRARPVAGTDDAETWRELDNSPASAACRDCGWLVRGITVDVLRDAMDHRGPSHHVQADIGHPRPYGYQVGDQVFAPEDVLILYHDTGTA